MDQLCCKKGEIFINQAVVGVLEAAGIKRAIVSPGSRNSPLLRSFACSKMIKTYCVVDERSAAFMALGMTVQSGEMTALCCTSGSAPLNYGPALAEAYYRRVPLLVISADRPGAWIDRDDGQTIRQYRMFDNSCVKASFNIAVGTSSYEAVRTVSEAIAVARDYPPAPVHVNIEFDDNLLCYGDGDIPVVKIPEIVRPSYMLSTSQARALGRRLASPARVLVFPGCMSPDRKILNALTKLASKPNVTVLAEPSSNICSDGRFINNVDGVVAAITTGRLDADRYLPDIVVTFGSSTVSRRVKKWLMESEHEIEHWHIGRGITASDRFMRLSVRIEAAFEEVLPQIASGAMLNPVDSDYQQIWRTLAYQVYERTNRFIAATSWSDLKAISTIVSGGALDRRICHISNGMSVRYGDIAGVGLHARRVDVNRGVAGIEGSTSTAVGASLVSKPGVTLITGDMSFRYDLNALTFKDIPDDFVVFVMDNEGGDIFRHIKATRQSCGREEFISCKERIEADAVAAALGFRTFIVHDNESLMRILSRLDGKCKTLVRIVTQPDINVSVLKEYFNQLKQL